MSQVTNPIIALRKVELTLTSKAGPVDILRGVDLSVMPGEAVGIVGPSGSGKTSLLMIIAGLERASAGNVRIVGEDFTRLNEDDLARARGRGIGIVFQSFHLVPTMTALENVALPLEFANRPDALATAARALEQVGLGARADHLPAQLSGGEQQRVAIARALAPRPRLVLADEPTGNLDGATGTQIMDLLFELRARQEITLVLVTHDNALAARADRVVSMRDGQIVSDTGKASNASETVAATEVRA